MSEANEPTPNEPTPNETVRPEVSPETQALVERQLPGESDEVKYHMMALVEAIKKRAESQIESTGDMTREAYVEAMRQAQSSFNKTGEFFDEQRQALEKSIADIEDRTTKTWDTLLDDAKKVGNRFERAVNAAWQILTESESAQASSSPSDGDSSGSDSSDSPES